MKEREGHLVWKDSKEPQRTTEPLKWQVDECVGTQNVRGDMKGGKAEQAGRSLC